MDDGCVDAANPSLLPFDWRLAQALGNLAALPDKYGNRRVFLGNLDAEC
jgi:hypothetical protein